jgi:hypothetical protein
MLSQKCSAGEIGNISNLLGGQVPFFGLKPQIPYHFLRVIANGSTFDLEGISVFAMSRRSAQSLTISDKN